MTEIEGLRGIGILGGMCPESTHVYAKTINDIVSAGYTWSEYCKNAG